MVRNSGFRGEVPRYRKISEELAREVKERYVPGELLPSEHDLAKRFKVNRHTIRMALEQLVTQGCVGKRQGKGTVVLLRAIDYPIHRQTRFTETLESSGRLAESRVLRKVGIPAPEEVAEQLQVPEDEPVILVETLRLMDGAPFSVVSHYFLLEQVYDVMRDYSSGSLHDFLHKRYGIKLKRTMSMISAVLPAQEEATLLEISGNMPLLQVKSVNVDKVSGQPVEYVVSRFKGAATQIVVNLQEADSCQD